MAYAWKSHRRGELCDSVAGAGDMMTGRRSFEPKQAGSALGCVVVAAGKRKAVGAQRECPASGSRPIVFLGSNPRVKHYRKTKRWQE
jgi:hypothetical protein